MGEALEGDLVYTSQVVYTRAMLKNVTLSADAELLDRVRQRLACKNRTLNEEFREFLAAKDRELDEPFDLWAFTEKMNLRSPEGWKFDREEANQR
jgi:hypothetical protein